MKKKKDRGLVFGTASMQSSAPRFMTNNSVRSSTVTGQFGASLNRKKPATNSLTGRATSLRRR